MINETHAPQCRSWIESANAPGHDFPIQNLPLGMFSRDGAARPGVAIGDKILDLAECADAGLLDEPLTSLIHLSQHGLNPLMGAPKACLVALRHNVFNILKEDSLSQVRKQPGRYLVDRMQTTMLMPCQVGDYTDFLTSIHHTERHGRLKGLADPLPAAFKYLPIAYHGRASSLRVSGNNIVRPNGQWKDKEGNIQFGPTPAMDFELELAAFAAHGNPLGQPIPLDQARSHIFGYCLLNDWSNKAGQWWEQVLGPFLGKSFGTTLSPWIVTEEALIPFRSKAPSRPSTDPDALPYLTSSRHQDEGGLAITLQASLQSARMRAENAPPATLTETSLHNLYWTFPQMLTHHASNGCNLQPGDLLGSGTISGSSALSMACLTEKTEAGKIPLQLPNGESRCWLEDGDEIILTAKAEKPGYIPIGFGECRAQLLPAVDWPQ